MFDRPQRTWDIVCEAMANWPVTEEDVRRSEARNALISENIANQPSLGFNRIGSFKDILGQSQTNPPDPVCAAAMDRFQAAINALR